ncbi:trypco2 family protein [Deinococcus arenicola]|uniref:trypco2 family protein n=1 Tax=Deinococcus arenicola TaxID=2994950 RepID=UPI0032B0040F
MQHIELELKTVLSAKAGGGFEWKLLTVQGNASDSQTQTLSLCWERRPLRAAPGLKALPADLPY